MDKNKNQNNKNNADSAAGIVDLLSGGGKEMENAKRNVDDKRIAKNSVPRVEFANKCRPRCRVKRVFRMSRFSFRSDNIHFIRTHSVTEHVTTIERKQNDRFFSITALRVQVANGSHAILSFRWLLLLLLLFSPDCEKVRFHVAHRGHIILNVLRKNVCDFGVARSVPGRIRPNVVRSGA